MPKGEIPKTTRNRTPEQEALLREVRHYQARMKMRIGVSNQIKAMARQGLIEADEAETIAVEYAKSMEKVEGQIIRGAAKQLKGAPIWEQWMKHVRGIDKTLAVQFVAMLQPIADFPNVAKLWAYAGYAVIDGHAARRIVGRTGKESKLGTPALKTLGFQAGDCFVRVGRFYREVYDHYKARDRELHPEKVPVKGKDGTPLKSKDGSPRYDYTDGHIHNRARRYAVKLFLSHLWQVWRELEGLPVPGPYAIDVLGHSTRISPWLVIEQDRQVRDAEAA